MYSKYLLDSSNESKVNLFYNVWNQIIDGKEHIQFNELKILNNNTTGVFFEYLYKYYPYDLIPYKNREVIDIGGNVGDTALFFAKKGAIVHSFEPMIDAFNIGQVNINLNPKLKKNIHFYNEAISCKNGTITLYSDNSTSIGASNYKKDGEIYEVKTITMTKLLKEYSINPDVLKIDCEGCEVEIINNNDLTMFNDIILEHHASITKVSAEELIKTLSKMGFNIKCYPQFDVSFKNIGIIHAYK